MHEVNVKGILSSHNGMNIYRGCLHGCIYCDARSKCYQMNHKFEDIEIKINAPQLLQLALAKKRKKCMIGTGAMSDPYIPIEKEYNLTRKCLEIIYNNGCGVAIQTKSDLILRDLDLLKKINERSKCVVQMTLTTFNDDLCRILEPNVCVTKRRAEVLNIMRDNNIPTVVWLSPFLPFINDTLENILGLLNYCKIAKIKGIICFGIGVTLREGDREYFYENLDKYFPGMKKRYIAEFGLNYEVPSRNNDYLIKVITDFCIKNDILYKTDDVFKYLNEFPNKYEQLSLF